MRFIPIRGKIGQHADMQTIDYLEFYTDILLLILVLQQRQDFCYDGWRLSYGRIARLSSDGEFNSKHLQIEVKPIVREIESDDRCLIFNGTIREKLWTDENEIMCQHYDHTKGRNIKGVNILNTLYCSNNTSITGCF